MAGLQEVAAEDLPSLVERVQSFLPESTTVHGLLKTRLQYSLSSEMRILVAPGLSSLVVLTNVSSGTEIQSVTMFWDSEHEEDEVIAKLLASTSHIDWNKSLALFGVPSRILQKIVQMMRSLQLGETRLVGQTIIRAHLYIATASTLATSPRLPKGFRLGPIQEDHVDHLHKHWAYGSSVSSEEYRNMLRILPGVAVYTTVEPATYAGDELQNNDGSKTLEDTQEKPVDGMISSGNTLKRAVTKDAVPQETLITDEDEAGCQETNALPVAWTSLSFVNQITNTYVLKEYRRQGLGRVVTVALAALLLQEDDKASAYIDDDNEASIKLHEQVGFIKGCAFCWLDFLKDSET